MDLIVALNLAKIVDHESQVLRIEKLEGNTGEVDRMEQVY
jgi:hypothetical protein